MNGLYYNSQGLTEYHFPVMKAPCIKTVIIIIIIIIIIITIINKNSKWSV